VHSKDAIQTCSYFHSQNSWTKKIRPQYVRFNNISSSNYWVMIIAKSAYSKLPRQNWFSTRKGQWLTCHKRQYLIAIKATLLSVKKEEGRITFFEKAYAFLSLLYCDLAADLSTSQAGLIDRKEMGQVLSSRPPFALSETARRSNSAQIDQLKVDIPWRPAPPGWPAIAKITKDLL